MNHQGNLADEARQKDPIGRDLGNGGQLRGEGGIPCRVKLMRYNPPAERAKIIGENLRQALGINIAFVRENAHATQAQLLNGELGHHLALKIIGRRRHKHKITRSRDARVGRRGGHHRYAVALCKFRCDHRMARAVGANDRRDFFLRDQILGQCRDIVGIARVGFNEGLYGDAPIDEFDPRPPHAALCVELHRRQGRALDAAVASWRGIDKADFNGQRR